MSRPDGPTCRTRDVPGTMKWHGWGGEGEGFDPVDRPDLWPYATAKLGIAATPRRTPVSVESIELPPQRSDRRFLSAIEAAFPPDRWSVEPIDRLLHAFGKSTRDVWRARHGRVSYAPDCVVYPETEEEVAGLLAAADHHDVALVPFGGGSNVAGCVEAHRAESRMIVAVNLRRMNRVLSIDRISGTVRAQAGILGPALEASLNEEGLTLGHFPDSFLYSTLGGWVATRSSGMLSDGYGNIEDMVVALRMVTPCGLITRRCVPHASHGPDVNWFCIGSEGTLGIITEVTLRVRAAPQEREYRGYLFPDFAGGIEALRACRRAGRMPALSRLNDPNKTQLSAAFKRSGSWLTQRASSAAKAYLARVRGFDLSGACLLIAAFEGERTDVRRQRRGAERIYRRHGAAALGRSPGEAFAESKFDFPHIRDFLMDHDVICDVADTAATWDRMMPLYTAATNALTEALGRGGRRSWLGCHLSHTYDTGASLYFSFAFTCRADPGQGPDPDTELAHYVGVKQAALDCFSAHGGTLSHHHAVGYEHLPWLCRESVLAGGTAVDALKATLDPRGIMNPGKLTSGFTVEHWLRGPKARDDARVPGREAVAG